MKASVQRKIRQSIADEVLDDASFLYVSAQTHSLFFIFFMIMVVILWTSVRALPVSRTWTVVGRFAAKKVTTCCSKMVFPFIQNNTNIIQLFSLWFCFWPDNASPFASLEAKIIWIWCWWTICHSFSTYVMDLICQHCGFFISVSISIWNCTEHSNSTKLRYAGLDNVKE